MKTAIEIEEQAAAWLARQDGGWGAEDQAALQAWLAEAIEHRVAYLRLEAAWKRADRLAALNGPESRVPSRLPAWPRIAAAACVLAVALGTAFIPDLVDRFIAAQAYTTAIGGRESLTLADGSKIELNTNTLLRASIDGQRRQVWLERGEAYFDVAPDKSRPFAVLAGTRKVTVLGTRFSVRRDGDDVQVKVVEGRVAVDSGTSTGREQRRPAEASAALTQGQVMIARNASSLVIERTQQALQDELSWRRGVLVMDQWSLARAAAEFNRYNRKQIAVEGAAADIRLGGSFEAGNVEAFTRLLQDGFGLRVEARGESIVVSN